MSYSAVLLRKTAGPTFPLSAFRYLRFACFSLFLWLKLFYKFRLCFGNNCSFNFTHAIPVKLRVYSLFFTLYIVFSLSVRFAYSVFNERCIVFRFAKSQCSEFRFAKLSEDSSLQDLPLFVVDLSVPLFHILQFSRQRKLPVLAFASAKTTQWWAQVDSNHRPPAYQASALTS